MTESYCPVFRDGRQLAVGERDRREAPEAEAPASSVDADRPDGTPARPCSNCGRSFKPTPRRRMLCADCYRRNGTGSPYEPAYL